MSLVSQVWIWRPISRMGLVGFVHVDLPIWDRAVLFPPDWIMNSYTGTTPCLIKLKWLACVNVPQSFGTRTRNYMHDVFLSMRIFCQMVYVAILISSELLNMVAMFALHLAFVIMVYTFRIWHTRCGLKCQTTLFSLGSLSILLLQWCNIVCQLNSVAPRPSEQLNGMWANHYN